MNKFKSGFVTIIGRTNVGKSTLINQILGEKVSIISPRPQTTRNEVKGILTEKDYQIIFLDTPGVHKPKNKLDEFMNKTVLNTLGEVDLILFMVEADGNVGPGDKFIAQILQSTATPVYLVINKIDKISENLLKQRTKVYQSLSNFKETICISSINKTNLDLLIRKIRDILPEGPMYYPGDLYTDQLERNIVSEIIREKLLLNLKEEIPHGTAVEIDSMKESEKKGLISISSTILCEKDSHKKIIIGKSGAMIKKIGTQARMDIENLLGTKVFLDLWVKVKKDWRNDKNTLKNLGYTMK